MNLLRIKNLPTPIAVIGIGKSGTSAANLLAEVGFSNDQILLFDEKNPAAKYQDVQTLLDQKPKTFVVSPGVPLSLPWIVAARSQGVVITSEISIGSAVLDTEKVIGVTGSVGKSTVTSLLGVGAKAADQNAFVGGNLGIPLCDYAAKKLRGGPAATWVVLELSSYQLENCVGLQLEHSIVTYLSSNHLERYPNLDEYYRTKLIITKITSGTCLFNGTSADCRKFAHEAQSKYQIVNAENFSERNLLQTLALIGSHNKDNFALAAEMSKLCGWPSNSLVEMTRYPGLTHRLEFVATLNGVTYINDSKATAMDSVLVAVRGCLEGLGDQNKLFLLLGGKDKNLPWEDLSPLSSDERIVPVFFGQCADLAKTKSQLLGEIFERLGSAINYSQKRSRSGDVVLLSPGGTSLDEFKNFEERGDFFKTLVLSSAEN